VAEWGLALFGNNLNTVRLLHHLVLWFFAVFLVIHLYLAIYTIVVSRTTEIDTLISGKKFVFKEEISPESE
jgi:Ni/Fe-hydrogenase 1 B-type cytochrome subunit